MSPWTADRRNAILCKIQTPTMSQKRRDIRLETEDNQGTWLDAEQKSRNGKKTADISVDRGQVMLKSKKVTG